MPIYRLPEDAVFPDPRLADEDGLIAVGGDLSAQRLVAAYQSGIFPWYSEGESILWFSPDPRMVLNVQNYKRSKSLERTVKSTKYEVRIDTRFGEVIERCAAISRPGQDGTWITDDMKAAYAELHRRGLAHSFETYLDGDLVGGLYGVSIGAAFFGESMFHEQRDASKVAFDRLVSFALQHRFHFVDAQQPTKHLASLGAEEVSRESFLKRLAKTQKQPTLQEFWTNQ